MADFSPEARRSAIWATDARKIAAGRAVDLWLEKTGQKEIEDISNLEPVQWGLRLQAPIARAVGERLNVRLKELDIEGTHAQHPWMRSHFDYVSEDNKTLYEVKNYNAFARDKYGADGSQDILAADWAQCVHEAAVFGVEKIVLCVLFGGQELVTYPLSVDDSMKEALIHQEAAIWAHVQTVTPPDSSNPEDLRTIFPISNDHIVTASMDLEAACMKLKQVKAAMKQLEDQEEILQGMVMSRMQSASVLQSMQGKVLATWKTAKDSQRFDSARFKAEMPKVYEQYVTTTPGSRRFLVK